MRSHRILFLLLLLAAVSRAQDLEDAARRLRSTDPAVRKRAIDELAADRQSAPLLLRALAAPSERVGRAAQEALYRYVWRFPRGPTTWGLFDQAFRSSDARVRRRAAYVAGTVGKLIAKVTGDAITRLLDDKSRLVRLEAATALWWMDIKSDRALDILVGGVAKQDAGFSIALRGLRGVGSTATHARPILLRLLGKTRGASRAAIARTYVAIGGDRARVVDIYVEALNSANERLAAEGVAGLIEVGPICVPPVLEASRSENPRVRRNAAWVLRTYSGAAAARLEELAADEDPQVARAAGAGTPPEPESGAFGPNRGAIASARAVPLTREDHKRMNAAVDAGLAWLARHQDDDGRWDADGFARHDPADDPCWGRGVAASDERVTALTLLGFLGAGYVDRATKDGNPYAETVLRAFEFLVAQQNDDGRVGATLLDHAVATCALAEGYWMTRNPRYRKPATLALRQLASELNDDSVAPLARWWGALAMKAGLFGGLKFDPVALAKTRTWLKHPDRASTSLSAAASLACRALLGEDRTNPSLQRLARAVKTAPDDGVHGMERMHFATLGLFQIEGDEWRAWAMDLAHRLPRIQHPPRAGPLAGSWDPGASGLAGGRVYVTAILVLCLEVHYRYDRPKKPDK